MVRACRQRLAVQRAVVFFSIAIETDLIGLAVRGVEIKLHAIGLARFRSKTGLDIQLRIPYIVRFRRTQDTVSRFAAL